MKYFHLSPERTPKGPYSAEELRALRASGAIDDNTLAAAAGDADWRPYRELHLEPSGSADGPEPPPMKPRELGACPFCGKQIEALATPAECPHCGKTLHPGTSNPWHIFVSCMRRYACFRGRASRTEFWSFYLFYFLINLVVETVWKMVIMGIYDIPYDLEDQMKAAEDIAEIKALLMPHLEGCLVASTGEYLFPLVMLLPFYGVLVRRLHDRGHSACSLILSFIGYGGIFCGLAGLGALFGPVLLQPGQTEGLLGLVAEQHITAIYAAVSVVGIGLLLVAVTGIYMLVCCLLPSKEGANKYGPGIY